jgi:hypothetical protein
VVGKKHLLEKKTLKSYWLQRSSRKNEILKKMHQKQKIFFFPFQFLLQAVLRKNCFHVNCAAKFYAQKRRWNVTLLISTRNVRKNIVASYASAFIARAIPSWRTSIRITNRDLANWIWKTLSSFRILNAHLTQMITLSLLQL